MPSDRLDQLLNQLETHRLRFDALSASRVVRILGLLGKRQFTDAISLIRFHEALLFLCAYPASRQVYRASRRLASTIAAHVARLMAQGNQPAEFEDESVSGVIGTWIWAPFSFKIAQWLADRFPDQVSVDWSSYEKWARLGSTLPRFLPLLSEDSLVEANVPYRAWLAAARGRSNELGWLVRSFDRLSLSPEEKAELYESLELPVRLQMTVPELSRTLMMREPAAVFCHTTALIRRSDVSLLAALESEPLPVEQLSRGEGKAILDMARAASAVRYRELYGFTYGDETRVLRADLGRGVEVFVSGVPPQRRLPLRAYHAGFILKNGVPVGYVEGLSLFERMEVGFNIYYTFREGESAWLYARVLRLFRQLLGVTCFAIDPYQIGHENEEAIESGAFWFYRKLGFRPTRADLAELVESEEKKIAARPGYRTPQRLLKRFATGPMVFEVPPSGSSAWDEFQVRKLGLAVQHRMARRFGGRAERIRAALSEEVSRALGMHPGDWKPVERQALENLALVLGLIPNLDRWTPAEKKALVGIAKAKAGRDESWYLRRLQRHARLRAAVIRLGS